MEKLTPTMADIRPPQKASLAIGGPPEKKKNIRSAIAAKNFKKSKQPFKYKIPLIIALSIIFLGIGAGIFDFLHNIDAAAKIIPEEAMKIKKAAVNFRIEPIAGSLKAINSEIQNIFYKTKIYGIYYFFEALAKFLENTSQLSEDSLVLTQNLDNLQKNGLNLFIGQKGEELIFQLEKLKNIVADMEKNYSESQNQISQLPIPNNQLGSMINLFQKNYSVINFNLGQLKEFLGALIDLLQKPNGQHLLVLFQNESEIRPSGGFLGSYADLTIQKGGLKDLKVDDIYNADRQLNLQLIPPRELQGITTKWGARDANWFFDFPTSAKKVTALLEQSKLYSQNQIEFVGIIALNTKVLGTLLEIIGPIPLPQYNQTIDSKNFLAALQYEVEAGRDKKPGQNPKKILSVLTPLIFEKLKNLDGEQKEFLIGRIKNHLVEKDLMFYFEDWRIQKVLEDLGIAGNILVLPKNFSGDYLAVINANIAGGKTDAFITQHLDIKSKITAEGKIINQLKISRRHAGDQEKDWWYRMANKNYLKILVPENSKIISIRGNSVLPPQNKTSYSPPYQSDPDLILIEQTANLLDAFQAWTGKEFGKTFFAAWFNLPAGETKTLTVNYENGVRLDIQPENHYQFIFEKQSGVDGSLEYSITAPPGYIWKESGKPTFEYGTQQIKAREIIDLTLIPI